MEFQYSEVIDPSLYESEGLCQGIPLRMHTHSQKEDIGTLRCQEDWNCLVQPIKDYRGGLDKKWNFMSVSLPECLPDRLEIVSYANEFAFLYDDLTEGFDQAKLNGANDDMEAKFRQATNEGSIASEDCGKTRMQKLIFGEMMAIDPTRAMTSMAAWAEFLRLAAGRQHGRHFRSLEEYLPYRSNDVGKWFWYGLVTFGMAITISESELEDCERLMAPAWAAAALQNDIFSWPKERDAANQSGRSIVINAVWVLMQEKSINEDRAIEICREKTKEFVATYVQVVKQNRQNEAFSLEFRRYLEAVLYSLSGNAVWSVVCPRYHPKRSYNESQLALMWRGTNAVSANQASPSTEGMSL